MSLRTTYSPQESWMIQLNLCKDIVFDHADHAIMFCLMQVRLADFHWTRIKSIYIAPVEILIDKFRPFIFVAFDYEDSTTHFKELISRN